jgi:uncharacterized protein (DUF952 family)
MESERVILHITSRREWEAAQAAGEYRGDTLGSDGFIHCSLRQQVVEVANAHFRGQRDLVLLCIAEDKVQAEIRYEDLYHAGQKFPHIYGPLNLDAVVAVEEVRSEE